MAVTDAASMPWSRREALAVSAQLGGLRIPTLLAVEVIPNGSVSRPYLLHH
jgi:hypothetical protein